MMQDLSQPNTTEKTVPLKSDNKTSCGIFTNFIATPETNDNFIMAGDRVIAQKVDVKDAELIIASLKSRQHLVAALKEIREHYFNRRIKMNRGTMLEYVAYALALGEGREPQSYFDPNKLSKEHFHDGGEMEELSNYDNKEETKESSS